MFMENEASSFWETALSPITNVCVAVTRMGVGRHSKQSTRVQGGKCELRRHSDIQELPFLSTIAARDANRNKIQMCTGDPSSPYCERSKVDRKAAKYANRKDEDRSDFALHKVEYTYKEEVEERKKIKILEKRILVPFVNVAEKNYSVSNNWYGAKNGTDDTGCQMPMEVTRIINVQGMESCVTSSPLKSSGLKDIDSGLFAEKKALVPATISDKQESSSTQSTFPIDKSHVDGKQENSEQRLLNSGELRPVCLSEEEALLPKRRSNRDSVNLDGDELGGANEQNDSKIEIHITLPKTERPTERDAAVDKKWGRGRGTLPKIKSNFSTARTLQNVEVDDAHSLDYANLTEGYKKARRRNKMRVGHFAKRRELRSSHGKRETEENSNEMLVNSSKTKGGNAGKKTKDRKKKETKKDENVSHIKYRVDATYSGEIKSIMKNGNSYDKNNNKDMVKIRRVSFSKATIRIFVPDKAETTMT